MKVAQKMLYNSKFQKSVLKQYAMSFQQASTLIFDECENRRKE